MFGSQILDVNLIGESYKLINLSDWQQRRKNTQLII